MKVAEEGLLEAAEDMDDIEEAMSSNEVSSEGGHGLADIGANLALRNCWNAKAYSTHTPRLIIKFWQLIIIIQNDFPLITNEPSFCFL